MARIGGMTRLWRWLAVLLVTTPLALSYGSCIDAHDVYRPVYLSYEALRSAVAASTARAIDRANRILTRGDMLYVVEYDAGLHVVDNTDPSEPVKLAFIEVPGARNAVTKDGLVYIDSYVDLVVIDVTDVEAIQEVGRLEDALPYWRRDHWEFVWDEPPDPSQGIVVDSEFVRSEEGYCFDSGYRGSGCSGSRSGSGGSPDIGGGQATVGSLSAFFVVADTLYLLADEELLHRTLQGLGSQKIFEDDAFLA